MIDREGFQFDLETRRFIENRWETVIGKRVLEEIIQGIKNSVDIRAILDRYVLDDEENIDPYRYPIYPKNAMTEGCFWVLTHDDLRGVQFYNEDFFESRSLEKKALSYCVFYKCNLENASLGSSDLSYADIEECNLKNANLSSGVGISTRFISNDLQNTLMSGRELIDCDFSGSDARGAFLGDTRLENMTVDYLTRFDYHLSTRWRKKEISKKQIPDILRAIRIAYEKAELWDEADKYLFEEKAAHRKYILEARLKEEKSFQSMITLFKSYFIELSSGYATKPMRIIVTAFIAALLFAIYYASQGTLSSCGEQIVESKTFLESIWGSIYFSFTTFSTLGYGDLTFGSCYPKLRIVSTIESWIGAMTIALFVTALARKVFR